MQSSNHTPSTSSRGLRAVMILLVLLASGAMLTVLTSWVGAFRSSYPQLDVLDFETNVTRGWPHPVPDDWDAGTAVRGEQTRWSDALEFWEIIDVRTHYSLARPFSGRMTDRRFGLPCRAMCLWSIKKTQFSSLLSEDYSACWTLNWPTLRRLPLRPLWPGFALNALFYAAIAWGLWQLPLALRRRSRAKRGACVRCGYDLKGIAAGTVCPECGNAK